MLYRKASLSTAQKKPNYSKLDFGKGEQIFYGEFDGMRDKRVLVKIIGE
jgi:thiamine phosphate synthase YjbQ (UPF0047 family)